MPRVGWGIKPLTQTRIPKSMVLLAVRSTLAGSAASGYRETWRCATASYSKDWPHDSHTTGYGDATPERLWREISGKPSTTRLTHLWTHNLTSTVRLTDALRWLPSLGWTLTAFSLNPGAPWMAWRRGDRTIKMLDTASVWPGSLDNLATVFGMGRRMPDLSEANNAVWLAASRQDVAILDTAVRSYVEWIRAEDLGTLAVTGNGQAWAAFRRRFLSHGVLVHDDETLHQAERRAMWTGRCEAWWHGSIGVANVSEWDFSKAHTRLSAALELPTYPQDDIPEGADVAALLADERYALLAEVDVRTSEPVAPTTVADHIAWPVGEFSTTLWAPELEALLEAGATVHIRRGWRYRRAPVLRDWATWILAQLDDTTDAVPAWRKEVLRKWGNTLVGRFAMRYPKWDEIGQPTSDDAFCMPYFNVDTGEESMLMQVGRTLWLQQGTEAPHDSAPAVTGYVMSAMRAKLWRLIRSLPPKVLLYVDTDSLLVAERHNRLLAELAQTPAGEGLRLKRSWSGMAIYGPRQVVTGDAVRISGLPKGARRKGRHEWEGEVTESLTAALAGRSPDAVRSTRREWVLEGTDVRRLGHGVGWTEPFTVGPGAPVY